MLNFLRAALVVVCLPVGLAAKETYVQIPVTQDFSSASLNWAGGLGTMYLHWQPVAMDGRLAICGVVAHSGNSARTQSRDALRKGWIKVGGKKVIRNLRFFSDNGLDTDVLGDPATCVVTQYPSNVGEIELGIDPSRANF